MLWLLVAHIFFASSPAAAKMVQGPTLGFQSAQPADVLPDSGPETDATLARRRFEANLLVPLPKMVPSGAFVVKTDFFSEDRMASTDTRAAPGRHVDTAGWGAVFLPTLKWNSVRPFFVFERYAKMNFDASPMTEYISGVDLSPEAIPFRVVISDSDQAESRLLVRLRRFPGFNKWLFLAGHRIQRASGWGLDVTIPSHVLASFETAGMKWKFYGGQRWASREYPFNDGPVHGWMDGYSSQRLLGVRREIRAPLYAGLEVGMEKEVMRFVDERGETLASHATEFAPWVRLTLETWVKR